MLLCQLGLRGQRSGTAIGATAHQAQRGYHLGPVSMSCASVSDNFMLKRLNTVPLVKLIPKLY